jgi:hypothetical protein
MLKGAKFSLLHGDNDRTEGGNGAKPTENTRSRNSDIGLVHVGEKSVLLGGPHSGVFGSFRASEIPCPAHDSFNEDTLVWADVVFFSTTKSVTAHVQHPKSNRIGGEKVVVLNSTDTTAAR